MAVGLGKQIAIVELFKAEKCQKEICKDLKVNRMLVWRTLKRYKESRNMQNRPGQGCPQSARTSKLIKATREKVWKYPKRSIQKTAKEANVLYGTMFMVLHRDLKMFPFKYVRKQLLLAKTVEKCLARARIILSHLEPGMLPNLVFTNKRNSTFNTM